MPPVTLETARKWRNKQPSRRTAQARSHYARHHQLAIDLRFDPREPWTASDIARFLKASDPALKAIKESAIVAALCRLFRAEEKRRDKAGKE